MTSPTIFQEGTLFELALLFPGIDPNEKLTWHVLENVAVDGGRRITIHVYYLDVFMFTAIGHTLDDNIKWSFSK